MKRSSSSSERVSARGTRGVPVQMPAPLPPHELKALLAGTRKEARWWRAVMGMVAEDIADAMQKVAHPKAAANPGEMAHIAGGLAWALDFRDRLEAEWKRAQRLEKEGEAK